MSASTNPVILPDREAGSFSWMVASSDGDERRTQVRRILDTVEEGGLDALLDLRRQFDGIATEDRLVWSRDELLEAADAIPEEERKLLEDTASRIRLFAGAQRSAICDVDIAVPGGRAGHTLAPVATVGCYAPGGRYPLPSTVLMTAVPARVAGVETVIVASPSRDPRMLAAAAVAGADLFLNTGGAQAVAALVKGIGTGRPVDMIVGPGNAWVTEAKAQVAGVVGIDMLAGPSELVVIADGSACARTVAADLLAQAEHDVEARVCLITDSSSFALGVRSELRSLLDGFPNAATACASLEAGACVVVENLSEAVALADRLAPEHLAVHTEDAAEITRRVKNAGAVFIGGGSAEVFGDYGVGPNHTLPTGGGARFSAGLSVFDFLRARTWMQMDEPSVVADEVAALARMEGLEGHALAAACRLAETSSS